MVIYKRGKAWGAKPRHPLHTVADPGKATLILPSSQDYDTLLCVQRVGVIRFGRPYFEPSIVVLFVDCTHLRIYTRSIRPLVPSPLSRSPTRSNIRWDGK
ncbi:hypothetical protein ElyMa_003668200 [Elysia marginata]|uniref:Uncharacterized protein n=1 Tax=Elysia marginata TaxID=1093978 RepID=A0AAV4F053_9GAST|nr:hypothetical protein ElyMa_003668200 [Elysia marginata]